MTIPKGTCFTRGTKEANTNFWVAKSRIRLTLVSCGLSVGSPGWTMVSPGWTVARATFFSSGAEGGGRMTLVSRPGRTEKATKQGAMVHVGISSLDLWCCELQLWMEKGAARRLVKVLVQPERGKAGYRYVRVVVWLGVWRETVQETLKFL